MSGGANAISQQEVAYQYNIPAAGGFDGVGNLLSVADSVLGTWSYTSDHLNRLLTGTALAGPYSSVGLSWAYDGFGNRWGQAVSGSPSSGMPFPQPWTASPDSTANDNRIGSTSMSSSGWTYDNAGNVTFDGNNSYAYDAEERLCAVESTLTGGPSYTGYLYDGDGNRIAKGSINGLNCNLSNNGFTLQSSYVRNAGGQEGEWNGAGAWVHTNVFAGGALLATYSSVGNDTYFAFQDWLGTKRAEISPDGCLEAWASLPYGDDLTPSGNCPDATEHHFTGKERDTESGNDYFPARYYASSMGRWMSPDWGPAAMPVPYANLENPQSLNLYSYVLNNPLSHTDPTGHECTVDGEKHGGLWCFAHKFGLVETQHESANDAREAMAPMHGLIFGGKRPQDVAKSTDDKAVNAYFNSLSNYLMGIAAGGQGPANSISMAAIGPGFAGLKNATPVGSALKDDLAHQSAFWMREEASEGGAVFKITGGDGVQRTLIQIPGEVNGVAGRFEYIVDQAGNLTHEMFVEGGGINGVPIKP